MQRLHPALQEDVELDEERNAEINSSSRIGNIVAKTGNLETSENDDIKMAIDARGN